ncbi:MAG: hypothetical protein BGO00_02570 [Alphaproteobacteria bacterium 62-8]|nr:MAG: hypothetical protein BGO00_02570 [Alphaproteobacteria bacterium 62-8]
MVTLAGFPGAEGEADTADDLFERKERRGTFCQRRVASQGEWALQPAFRIEGLGTVRVRRFRVMEQV